MEERPLKRVIQQEIENPLATRILSGDFGEGDSIEIDEDKHQQFHFKKVAPVHEGELVE